MQFHVIRHVMLEAVHRLRVLLAGHALWIARLGNHLEKDDQGKCRIRPGRCPIIGGSLE
ncbi:MAG: hypothetical protein ABIT20_03875 [Gemmatimonadaceae bacterium]